MRPIQKECKTDIFRWGGGVWKPLDYCICFLYKTLSVLQAQLE